MTDQPGGPRPFKVLGLQQVAVGSLDRDALRHLWIELFGIEQRGEYSSEKENVSEDILVLGEGAGEVEIDLMRPLDPDGRPAVHKPALNHIGLWVDDLAKAVEWLSGRGVRFTPGGIRKGAGGHRVCFIHPKGSEESPVGGAGVLIELVQAPPQLLSQLAGRAQPAVRKPGQGSGRDLLAWFDMEMTGLDPDTCVPLEVAVVITQPDLTELDSFEAVIHQSDEALSVMSPLVHKMHTDNGLLERVKGSTTTLEQAQAGLIEVLARWCKPKKAVLCGNSIHMDRRFLVRYFPDFEALLHYRMVDVSSFKEMIYRWFGQRALFVKESAHTAMADARASIAEMRHYRDTVVKPRKSG